MRKQRDKSLIVNRVRSRIKQIRGTVNLTQTGMSRELGITQQTYSRIESGAIQPQLEHIITIISKFDINPGYLLLGEGRVEKTPEKCPYLVTHQADRAQEYACVIREIINNRNIAETLGLFYELSDGVQKEVLNFIREKAAALKVADKG